MRKNMVNGVVALIAAAGFAAASLAQTSNNTPPNKPSTPTTITPQTTIKKTAPTNALNTNTKGGTVAKGAVTTQNGVKATKTTQNTRPTKTTTTGTTQVAQTNTSDHAGREHLDLSNLFMGEWNTTSTTFTTTGTQPTTSNGHARFFPTMGGRFVCADFDSENNGQINKGMGFFGFNTTNQRYESTLVGNQSTAITYWTGAKTNNNTFTWTGSFTDPTTGKTTTGKGVTAFTGKNAMTYTLYNIGTDGKEFKSLEVNYARTSLGTPLELRPVEGNTRAKTTTRTTNVTDQTTSTDK